MGDNIIVVALECTGCEGKGRYHYRKNKKVQRDKLEIKKYCKFCKKHCIHKETKQGCSSVGRATVSKTVGREFETLHPCFGDIVKIMKFFDDIKSELGKISWINKRDNVKSTLGVLLVTVILGLFLLLVDFIFSSVTKFLLGG